MMIGALLLGTQYVAPKGAKRVLGRSAFYKHGVPNGTLLDGVDLSSDQDYGCGRRSRTFIFEFKARRVADYTIPQGELMH
jgi:hypothetical protein